MKIDMHVHTKYSADCDTEPRHIVKKELSAGIACVAITDHNSFSSFRDFRKTGIKVIKGQEISTDKGHLVGLFLGEFVKSGDFFEACDEIKSQDGISVLPHPFRSHKNPELLARSVDMVEIFNARTSGNGNRKALLLANGGPGICGSDAHFLSELGRATVSVETDDLDTSKRLISKGRFKMSCFASPFYVHPATWVVKGTKMLGHLVKR
ncbi:MAG: PHP domain-containing protein [Candidatus Aenigmarchaeota archaeon]|nr:PHP domain-containing protein [Candidatus Aenigmarchaeota archaeon]